jgi:hypothetical protein
VVLPEREPVDGDRQNRLPQPGVAGPGPNVPAQGQNVLAQGQNAPPRGQNVRAQLQNPLLWINVDIQPKPKQAFQGPQPGPTSPLNDTAKEFDFFSQIFTGQCFDILVEETNRYAEQRQAESGEDPNWSPVTLTELKAWIGIRMFMSVLHLPSNDMYWSQDWLFGKLFIPKIMKRDRFDKISLYFHASDRTQNPPRGQDGHDKLHHIRPIHDLILGKCLEMYRPHRNQSIDEAMIPFRGRLGFKQYLPAKPTKYGIKVWCRADPNNGYMYEFQVYTGKENRNIPEVGLATRVVVDLSRSIQGQFHIVNVDNFFTSPDLLGRLLAQNTYARGTVRKNRKGYPVNLLKEKDLKVQGQYNAAQQGEMLACAWKDKKVIHTLSTADDPANIASHVARKQRNGTIRQVDCPVIIKEYNDYMNGVDRADQIRTTYSTYRTSRKWWHYLFWFLFDLAVSNSFVLMKESPHHVIHTRTGRVQERKMLDYRMNLCKQLIGDYRCDRKRKAPPSTDPMGNSHFPVAAKKSKCVQCKKQKIRHEPKWKCSGCGVNLCVECFLPYHRDLNN